MQRRTPKFGTMAHPRRYPPGSVPRDLFPQPILAEKTSLPPSRLNALLKQGVTRPVAYTTTNVALYNEDSVGDILHQVGSAQALPYTTEDAIAVFKALKSGAASLIDITIETGIDPRHVEAIAKHYAQMSRGFFVDASQLQALAERAALLLVQEEGDPPIEIKSVDDLLEIVHALTKTKSKKKVCPRCRAAEPANECAACVVRALEKEIQRHAPVRATFNGTGRDSHHGTPVSREDA